MIPTDFGRQALTAVTGFGAPQSAPDLRRAPAPGPQTRPRRRPVAPSRSAGGSIRDARSRVAASIAAHTPQPTAPRAGRRCSRPTPGPPQCREGESSYASCFTTAALSGCSSSWLSRHRRRGRCMAGQRLHNGGRSPSPMGGGRRTRVDIRALALLRRAAGTFPRCVQVATGQSDE
jgi:hypothetical protein